MARDNKPEFDETRDPWTRLSKQVVFDSPWITVEDHTCRDPRGNDAQYGVVRFKNRAVGVIPLHDDGTITLVGQYRFALEQYSWELPEGGCPKGREMIDTAAMELSEETGLKAESLTHFMGFHLSNSVSDEFGALYLARGLTQGDAHPEDCEELRTRRVTLDTLLEEIETGSITDSITIMGAYKLALWRAQGKI